MRVLVIGATSYIAKRFLRVSGERFEVTALTRDETLRSYFDLDASYFKNIDTVINFAAIVHNRHPEPAAAERINAALPVYLAEMAKAAGVKQFVQLSTVAVYGRASQIDAGTPAVPATVYGESKLRGDTLLSQLSSADFAVAIVRPTVVYGQGAPGNMRALMRLIARGLPLPLNYSKNRRSILYVGNLVEALERIVIHGADGMFLLRDREMLSLFQIASALRNGSKRHALFFSLPGWLLGLIRTMPFLPSEQLYGNLVIDDSKSRQLLGEYAVTPSDIALRTMAEGTRV
jgi:UDP-glucose 4-epimerase